jgi:hypothetical protein
MGVPPPAPHRLPHVALPERDPVPDAVEGDVAPGDRERPALMSVATTRARGSLLANEIARHPQPAHSSSTCGSGGNGWAPARRRRRRRTARYRPWGSRYRATPQSPTPETARARSRTPAARRPTPFARSLESAAAASGPTFARRALLTPRAARPKRRPPASRPTGGRAASPCPRTPRQSAQAAARLGQTGPRQTAGPVPPIRRQQQHRSCKTSCRCKSREHFCSPHHTLPPVPFGTGRIDDTRTAASSSATSTHRVENGPNGVTGWPQGRSAREAPAPETTPSTAARRGGEALRASPWEETGGVLE